MLSGNETGWLLGDYLLSQIEPGPVMAATVVASSVVSSRMLAAIAEEHGACHVETLTGFKWLSRADEDMPGHTLVYAYEEAIGHCVDPAAVRDKDGISAAVLVCDLVARFAIAATRCSTRSTTWPAGTACTPPLAVSRPVADADEAAAVMSRLRHSAARPARRLRRDGHRPAARGRQASQRCADPVRW